MKLVVALGNPDPKYTLTRHNVGRLALQHWLAKQDSDASVWSNLKKVFTGGGNQLRVPHFKGIAYKLSHSAEATGGKPAIISPDLGCYMNESGAPVKTLLQYFKISPTDLIVIHDDIDLPIGEVRVSTDSSAGGQNGVKSIIQHLGTQNFTRIRIGVEGRTENRIPPTDQYVLQRFNSIETEALLNIFETARVHLDKTLKM